MKNSDLTSDAVGNLRDRLTQLQTNNNGNNGSNKTLLDEELCTYIEQRLQKFIDSGGYKRADDSGSGDGSSVSSRMTQSHRVIIINTHNYIFSYQLKQL